MSKTKERVPGTLSAWRNAGLHTAQLESGAWVKFRYPDLSMLTGAGKVPEKLRPIAVLRIAEELKLLMGPAPEKPDDPDERQLDEQKLADNNRLNDWLLTQMVEQVAVDPTDVDEKGIPKEWEDVDLDPGDVDDVIPHEDQLLLLALAERDRDTDARGVVMGVLPLSRLARFREAHKCKPDCPSCEELRREGSSFIRRALQV